MNGPVNGDIHALVGAYAVDALDPDERTLFEAHLGGCADCRDEVASLREAGAMLSALTETPPPTSLKDRVLADVATVRPLPPDLSNAELPRPTDLATRRRRWLPAALVAAAAVAVVGAGAVVVQPWDRDQGTEQQLTATQQVLRADDAEEVSLDLDGASARLVRSPELGKAVLVTQDMPSAPEGKVYQLWLQDDAGSMIPAGLMPDAANQELLLDGDAASATGAGITVEPDGGSKVPTSEPIALFDFDQAT